MNTKEAYDKFRKGERIGVIVTNSVTNDSSIIEIDNEGWLRRLKKVPDNTNYVVIEGQRNFYCGG